MTAMSMQSGDRLWCIAQCFYGDSEQAARLFEANGGRAQPDGTALIRYGLIYPGWVLRLPEANAGKCEESSEQSSREE
jgi:nucleoid-associated protein YgaU